MHSIILVKMPRLIKFLTQLIICIYICCIQTLGLSLAHMDNVIAMINLWTMVYLLIRSII